MRFLIFLLCAIIFLTSYQKQNKPVVGRAITEQERQASVMLDNDNQAIFVDQELAELIRITKFKSSRDDMKKLAVEVEVQTVIDKNVVIDVKCRFNHQDGEIEETSWQPKIIRRHELIRINFTSLARKANSYNIYFRLSK